MSESINFSNKLTLTKIQSADVEKILFDITDAGGLTISAPTSTGETATIDGDLTVTGDLTVLGGTVVNSDTKLSITNKNILMNVPSEPVEPGGSSTIDIAGSIATATVVNPGYGYPINDYILVIFDASPLGPGNTAVGHVLSDGSGNITIGSPVVFTQPGATIGLGYITAPEFLLDDAINHIPLRTAVGDDAAGTIVIRDWYDADVDVDPLVYQAPAGILWDEANEAWNLNKGIPLDIYGANVGTPQFLDTNPRIMNVGAPTDAADAVNYQTLLDWELDDMPSVDISGISTGQTLVWEVNLAFPSGHWTNKNISFADIDGITVPPLNSGYLFWDHDALPNPTFTFIQNIPYGDLSGMSQVAQSGYGNLRFLGDVSLTETDPNLDDGKVLAWDSTTQRWKDKDLTTLGVFSIIQDSTPTPTAYVETVAGVVNVVAGVGDVNVSSTAGAVNITTDAGDINIDATGQVIISSLGPVKINDTTTPDGDGSLIADRDIKIDANRNIVFGGVIFPTDLDNTANGKVISYNHNGGVDPYFEMVVQDVVTNLDNIKNHETTPTTAIYTNNPSDTIVMVAPDLGSTGINATPVTNETGVWINPGSGRKVVVEGLGTTDVHATDDLQISANSSINIFSATGNTLINGYEMPNDLSPRNAGDFVILDPSENKFIFKTVLELPATGTGYLHNDGSDNLSWLTIRQPVTTTLIVTVGAVGADFTTINAAIDYICSTYYQVFWYNTPKNVEIVLQADYVMNEQVVANAYDLSFITISSVITQHTVIGAALVAGFDIVDHLNIVASVNPAFAAVNGVKLPLIKCSFAISSNVIGGVGLLVSGAGSSAILTDMAGFTKFNINVCASDCGVISINSGDFSSELVFWQTEIGILATDSATINCRGISSVEKCLRGICAVANSTINASDSVLIECVQFGAIADRGSRINLYDADCRLTGISDSTGDIVVGAGSFINAVESDGGTGQWDGNVLSAITPNNLSVNGAIFK